MRTLRIGVSLWLALTCVAAAQTPPQLIPFNGTVVDLTGQPLAGVVPITFAIYQDQVGGVPLWVEIQSVTADSQGAFVVLLGAASPEGVLVDLFASGAPSWIGVQAEGQAEQPRTLLASVPYALKAADANTVGGLPVSAFLLAGAAAAVSPGAATDAVNVGASAEDRDGAAGGADPPTSSPDQVFLDDLIVDGSACVGWSCPGFVDTRPQGGVRRCHDATYTPTVCS